MRKITTSVSHVQEHLDFIKCIDDEKNGIINELARLGFVPVNLIRKAAEWRRNYGELAKYQFIAPRTFEPELAYYEDCWQYHYTDDEHTVFVYYNSARDIFEDNVVEVSIVNSSKTGKDTKLDGVRRMKRRIRPKLLAANKAIHKVRAMFYASPAGVEKRFNTLAEKTNTSLHDEMAELGYAALSHTYISTFNKLIMQHTDTNSLMRFDCKFHNYAGKFREQPEMSYFAEDPTVQIVIKKHLAPLQEVFNELSEVVTQERMEAMSDKIAGKEFLF